MSGPLNNKRHEHFAQLIAHGETAPKAYVIAGYSEQGAQQSANRLLKNAVVKDRIEQLVKAVEEPSRERAIEKAALDKVWVISRLQQVVERCMQAEQIVDSQGGTTGEYKFNAAGANKALELLGKEVGMFIDRKEVTNKRDLADMSDAELAAYERELEELERNLGS